MTTYKVASHGLRWVIEATLDEGEVTTMTCGATPTYAEVMERIKQLEQDDAAIDAKKRVKKLS